MSRWTIQLNEKVVVITGAGGVLCGAMVLPLLESGAKVALLDLNTHHLEKVISICQEYKENILSIQANVLDKKSLEHAHQKVLEHFGPCDLLINGAGGNHAKATTSHELFTLEDALEDDVTTFFDLQEEGIDAVFKLNFLGTLLPTQVFAKDMLGKEGCSIINISSMNAYKPLTKIPAYSSAKAAISNFTQWLAVYFSKQNIRVNAIAPGFFITEQNYSLLVDKEGAYTARANKILNHTPMERFGTPEELIGTVMYLLDPNFSGFVNGVVIPIDGAFSAYSGV